MKLTLTNHIFNIVYPIHIIEFPNRFVENDDTLGIKKVESQQDKKYVSFDKNSRVYWISHRCAVLHHDDCVLKVLADENMKSGRERHSSSTQVVQGIRIQLG